MAIILYSIFQDLFSIDIIAITALILTFHLYEFVRYLKLTRRELSTIEQYFYQRDFQDHLTKPEFLELFDIAEKRVISQQTLSLAVQNNRFDKLYYFALIPAVGSITLKNNDKVFSYLREGSWIGIVEFILNYIKNEDSKWLVNIDCDNLTDIITVYEFDKDELKTFLKKTKKSLLNKILLIWIKYLIKSVNRMNIHMAETYKISKQFISNDNFGAEPTLALGIF